jgi:capsular polysaccharide biosynthesis protein
LTNRFAPLIRVGLGLLAGLGLAFLAHYLDPTLRRRDEVETLGLSVLASLPRD